MVLERLAAASPIVLGIVTYVLERIVRHFVGQVKAVGSFMRMLWQKVTAPFRWLFWMVLVPCVMLSLIGVLAVMGIGLMLSRLAIMLENFGKPPDIKERHSSGTFAVHSHGTENPKDPELRHNSVRNSNKDSICIPSGNPFKSPKRAGSGAPSEAVLHSASPEQRQLGSLSRILCKDKDSLCRFEKRIGKAPFRGVVNELKNRKDYALGIDNEDLFNSELYWETKDSVEDDAEEDPLVAEFEPKEDPENTIVESPVKLAPSTLDHMRRSKSQVALYSQFRLSDLSRDPIPVYDALEDDYRTHHFRPATYHSRLPITGNSLHMAPTRNCTVSLGLILEDMEA